jgi:4-amino-4-deoxy-L-arabinose transferase-like glycosyltransferase
MILGITLLGLGFRLLNLGTKCFWQDEGVTFYFARGPIYEDGSPELYFRLLYFFQILFGDSEAAGRLLSVVAGTLFIPLFFLLARRLFGLQAALLSTLIVAISPYAIAVSQEMRMYSLMGLELVIVLYGAWRLLEQPVVKSGSEFKWYAGVFLAGLAGIYTHVIFAFMLAFLSLAFLFYNLKSSPKKILYWAITMAAMGLAYLPELMRWTERAGSRDHIFVEHTFRAIRASVEVMARSLSMFLFGFYYKVFRDGPLQFPKILLVIAALILVIGLVWVGFNALRRRAVTPPERRRAAGFMAAFLLFNFVLFLVLEVSSSRHMITMYVPLIMLLGLLLWQLQSKWRSILLGLLGLFTLLSLVSYYRAPYFLYEQADWRGLGRYLEANAQPDDVVFFEGGRNGLYTILYYAPQVACPLKYMNTKAWPSDPYQIEFQREYLREPATLYAELTRQYRRVWLVSLKGFNNLFTEQTQVVPNLQVEFGPQLDLFAIDREYREQGEGNSK